MIGLSLLLTSMTVGYAQSFVKPESVEFDAKNNRYLVSNKGLNTAEGFILATDAQGSVTGYFVPPGITSPNALEIVGDTIFAATEEPSIKGYLLSTGAEVVSWVLDSPDKFNGLAYDGEKYLFASAPSEKYIYRIDMADGSYTRWQSSTAINGLGYDKANQRVLVCGWGDPAKIQALNPSTGVLTTLYTGIKDVFYNIDGIVMDECGNYYASGWTAGNLYYFSDGFGSAPQIIATGKQGPADIGINHADRIVMLPKMNAHALELFDISSYCPKTSAVNAQTSKAEIRLYPNPASHKLYFQSEQEIAQIALFTPDGRSLGLLKPEPDNSVVLDEIPYGLILAQFYSKNQTTKTHFFIHQP